MRLNRDSRPYLIFAAACVLAVVGPFIGSWGQHRLHLHSARAAMAAGRPVTIRECRALVRSGELIGQPSTAVRRLSQRWTFDTATIGTARSKFQRGFGTYDVLLQVTFDKERRCTSVEIVETDWGSSVEPENE